MNKSVAMPSSGSDYFKFHLPFDAQLEKAGADKKAVWKIRGYASTGAKDRQGETVVQNGLNISPFLNFGWFNYDHDNTEILGYPDRDKTKMTPKGLYVEGTLLQSNPMSGKLWHLSQELKASGAPRQLGMSVEGKVKQRDAAGRIIQADVYNVALTPNPVNVEATFEAFAKSFADSRDGVFDTFGQVQSEAAYSDSVPPQFNLLPEDSKIPDIDRVYSAFRAISEIASYEEGRNYLRQRLSVDGMSTEEAVLFLQIVTGASRSRAIQQVAGLLLTNS